MSEFQNKYTTQTAKKFAESRNCTLICEYKRMNELHEFICSCGNHFITTFAKFQNRGKNQCNICGRKQRSDSDLLKYDDVKKRIEKYGCKLISTKYTNSRSKDLCIECHCGKRFITSFGML